MSPKGERMLEAMVAAAPAGSAVTRSYRGEHRLLLVYGVGQPNRFAARREHLRRGGNVAMLDLGYWDRDKQAMRVSVNELHPTAAQLDMAPLGDTRSRPAAKPEPALDPAGPILLVGIGPKSVHLYGLRPYRWEREALAMIKTRFPGRQVLWRPKGRREIDLPGTTTASGGDIGDVLPRCSLVVCRHSNVAVDATVAGIPVLCEAGAAAVLYASGPAPDAAARNEFLRRLAWWNWQPGEAAALWQWLHEVTTA